MIKLIMKLAFLKPKLMAGLSLMTGLILISSLSWVAILSLPFLFVSFKYFKMKPLVKDDKILKMNDKQIVTYVQSTMGPPPKNAEKLRFYEQQYKQKLGKMYISKKIQDLVFGP